MGFSTSAAVAVISIGVLISVGLLYPVVEEGVTDVSDASEGRHDRVMDARNSDAEIHNATYDASDSLLTVRADNTGTVTMETEHIDLLLDGRLVADRTIYVEDEQGRGLWTPGERMRIEAEGVDDPERVVVVTDTALMRSTENVTGVN